jgi:hypothetical protein
MIALTVSFKASNNFYYLPGQQFQPPSRLQFGIRMQIPFLPRTKSFMRIPQRLQATISLRLRLAINDWFETVKLNYGVDIQNAIGQNSF